MSSAILYLAIVVIWAGVLVPRWLRPHAHRLTQRPAEPAHEELDPVAEHNQTRVPSGGDASHPAPRPRASPSPAERRTRVLRARRRMLATLLLLTVGAVTIATAHRAAMWVIFPPAAMLAGFLLLLRAAARFDAKRLAPPAHTTHATVGNRAGKKHRTGRQRARTHAAAAAPASAPAPTPASAPAIGPAAGPGPGPVWEPAEPGWMPAAAPDWTPSADIIDLSNRMRDQVYDQYSDAAERAVGD